MIYVIKQTRITKETSEYNFFLDSIGYFLSEEEALITIKNNSLDLSDDGYYNYVCIMSFKPGLYSVHNDEKWFKWDKTHQEYKECQKPEISKRMAFLI